MHFCSNCHNMYYLKIRDEDSGNSLIYYCRNCGNEDTTLTADNVCVSETQLRRSEQKFTHMVNEYTKFDPTLPRINTIKCPNQDCPSNDEGGGGGKKTSKKGEEIKQAVASEHAVAAEHAAEHAAAVAEHASEHVAAEPITTKKKTTIRIKKSNAAVEAEIAKEEALQEAATLQKEPVTLQEAATLHKEAATLQEEPASLQSNNREVIYIRYDDINMKYVYLCVHCDTTWKTDNRL